MAAAVYTISSSPPIRHPHGTFRGTRLGAGDGRANEPASAGPHSGKRDRPPSERSGLRHAQRRQRGRLAAGRGISVRRAGFPRKIRVLAAKSARGALARQ
ncbi:hypothetical protein DF020_18590 [Burkholderia cenocepacia]|nr:hypothetical protein DF020_18590 [Burkholderia cenocepacia]